MGRHILFPILQRKIRKVQRSQVTCPGSELVNDHCKSPAPTPKPKCFPGLRGRWHVTDRSSLLPQPIKNPFSPYVPHPPASALLLLTPSHHWSPPRQVGQSHLSPTQPFSFKADLHWKYLCQNTVCFLSSGPMLETVFPPNTHRRHVVDLQILWLSPNIGQAGTLPWVSKSLCALAPIVPWVPCTKNGTR